jgi:DNA-binding CsgD family transcriptional regulator
VNCTVVFPCTRGGARRVFGRPDSRFFERNEELEPEDVVERTVRLTGREAQVLRLIARGCTYSQAAAQLGMSRHTVCAHIKNAYRKLDVHSAAAAVMQAVRLGLIL